ncbi:hypothetical protein OIU34_20115 [Pararhizobium sp. BT-229]|uniref:hypothetical protein n=1 Tax=Pararhizobium sp. BT-229 TaxID=2986923 RepID=UPI0021F7A9CC|nr:hypothetical protein [Pararhizobium sp. BT-229]MCV9964193.1 hypothetical protein [Pararhizobium sp. BT-229]
MKIVFPLFYSITGRLPGKRQARSYSYRELVEVDIREVSSEDAPVACVWRPNKELRHPADEIVPLTNHGKSGPGGTQFTRWHDGRHWKRMIMSDGRLMHTATMNDIELDRVQFQAMLGSGRIQHALDIMCLPEWVSAAKDVTDDPASQFDVVKQSARARVMDELEKALDNVISVDGVIHAACFEPFIAVFKSVRPGTDVCEMSVETRDYPLTIFRDRIVGAFAAGSFDVALSLATTKGVQGREQLAGVQPDILIPDAFSFDWEMFWSVTEKLDRLWIDLARVGQQNTAVGIGKRSSDPDQRFAALSSLTPETTERWERLGVSPQPLYEALEILDDREVRLSIPHHAATGMKAI